MLTPLDVDDYCHTLDATQHEAFYFLFTSDDGQNFGFVRTLWGQDTVLEIIALRFEGRTWVYQRGRSLTSTSESSKEASGPQLAMHCLVPWMEWHCRFDGRASGVLPGESAALSFDGQFRAEGPATSYRFGPYQQVQQDGVLSGSISLDGIEHKCLFKCSRDHSWGQRQMHIAHSWILASLPAHLYLAVLNLDAGTQTAHFGHYFSPPGQRQDFQSPRITAGEQHWHLEDTATNAGPWQIRRAASPLVAYLGVAGQEAIRPDPQPGDLYRDEIGPAMYTSPNGQQTLGFVEHARRITLA